MSPKESKLGLRIPEDLEREIEDTVRLFEEKTKVKPTKSSIVESAIREGLKVIKSNIGCES